MIEREGEETAVWRFAAPLGLHFDRADLYAGGDGWTYAHDRSCYRLRPGGQLRSDRLLNLFGYKTWLEQTGLSALFVRVVYDGGPCALSLIAYDGQTTRLVWSTELPATGEIRTLRFAVPPLLDKPEFLFFQLDTEGRTQLYDLAVVTREPAPNPVRLGIVITTFNRQAEVQEQVRLLEDLGELELDYHVYVIDNGCNLQLSRRHDATTVIPSANLGGAGGFTRGLLVAMDEGSFTHAMFMDDDAFCHPAAIMRAAAMLRYAIKPGLALSGAMNYLHDPGLQYEAGARIGGYGVHSIQMNVDTSAMAGIYGNARAGRPDYGAWWCFLFPLSAVETLPFPFFVRGDDIGFSLQNRFDIETMPGLVAWQPSFEFKIGPPVEYLVHRSFLTLPLLADHPQWTLASIAAGVTAAFDLELDGLRYPIAQAICRALEDVLTGPEFWLNSANTIARMGELNELDKRFTEQSFLPRWGHLPLHAGTRWPIRLLRRFIGRWNLPSRFCLRRAALTNNMAPSPGQAFLRPGMIYMAPDGSRKMSCARDWRWRRRLERRFAVLLAEYQSRFETLKTDYSAAKPDLQSAAAWRERLDMDAPERRLAHPAV